MPRPTPATPEHRIPHGARAVARASGRRLALRALVALAGAAGTPFAAGQTHRATPPQMRGPFYPPVKPEDVDADLTTIRGHSAPARGEVVEIQGRVIDARGRPLPEATIEVWQANAAGRYRHPNDDNPAPLDPEFDGYARIEADAQGAWRIRTIKPGAYRIGPDLWRTPHVHFEIRTGRSHLVTQMYFPGEPLNDRDVLLVDCPDPHALTATLLTRTEPVVGVSRTFGWDICLGDA